MQRSRQEIKSRNDMFNKKRLYIMLFLLFSQSTFALQEHTKLWLNGNVTGDLFKENKKIKYLIEGRLRLIDDTYVFEHTRLSAGLGYEFTPSLAGYIGFGYVMDKSTSGVLTHEDRPFQLLKWDIYKSKNFNLSNNSLLEERKQIESPDWAIRLREKFAIEIPIGNSEIHSIDLSDELFFNLNHPKWVYNGFFAENRAVIGIGTKVTPWTKIMLGYINQYQLSTHENKMSNGLIISLDVKLAS